MKIATTSSFRSALVGTLGAFALLIGCQGQGEGERCSVLNGNNDCVGALVCTAASALKLEDGVSRCCPDNLAESEVDSCLPRIGGGSGTGGSTSGSGGASSDGPGGQGGVEGGDACAYTSDCVVPLVCGPQGKCQPECRDNIDCDDGQTCSVDQRCVES